MRVAVSELKSRLSRELDLDFTTANYPTDTQADEFIRDAIRDVFVSIPLSQRQHLDIDYRPYAEVLYTPLDVSGYDPNNYPVITSFIGENLSVHTNVSPIQVDLDGNFPTWSNYLMAMVVDTRKTYTIQGGDDPTTEHRQITQTGNSTPNERNENILLPEISSHLKISFVYPTSGGDGSRVYTKTPGYFFDGNGKLFIIPAAPVVGEIANGQNVFYMNCGYQLYFFDYQGISDVDKRMEEDIIRLVKIRIAEGDEDYTRLNYLNGGGR